MKSSKIDMISGFLLGLAVGCLLMGCIAMVYMNSNDKNQIEGSFTVTTNNSSVTYYTHKITFHDDGMITFYNEETRSNVILSNYAIIEED